jgi:hypothetical protein
MRAEQSWSLLDPKPVLLYLSKHDDYIVYWNGIVMPHTMALCMAMEFYGIYPTPEMKTSLEKTYEKLYYGNAFETRAWDGIVDKSPVYPYLKSIMADHLKKVIGNADAEGKDVIGWFDYDKARKE